MRNVTYANSQWEVIYEGDKVLHLRSLRDKQLIIHCSSKSEFLKDEETDKPEFVKSNDSKETGKGNS